jgi:hypothetical protein
VKRWNRKKVFLVTSLILSIIAIVLILIFVKFPQIFNPKANSNKIGVRIGIVHAGGLYPNRQRQGDFLVYGANDALSLGFQSIEIFMDPRVCRSRPTGAYQTLKYCKSNKNTEVLGDSLTALAKQPDFQKVLDMPFKRFNLTIDTIDPDGAQQWELGGAQGAGVEPKLLTKKQLDATYKDFYDFTSYILERYKNSGKVFIFVNPSELDWHLTAYSGCRESAYVGNVDACIDEPASNNAIKNEIDYLNTVADAISQAKNDFQVSGIQIYHACEVNQVLRRSMRGKKSALTDVIPNTKCDLIAYSAHEARREAINRNDPEIITSVLDFISEESDDSPVFGSKNIIISEIGLQENILQNQDFNDFYSRFIKSALNWGVPYIQFWQLYEDRENGGLINIRSKNLDLTKTYDILYNLGRNK